MNAGAVRVWWLMFAAACLLLAPGPLRSQEETSPTVPEPRDRALPNAVQVLSTNGVVEVLRSGARTWDLVSLAPPRNVLHPGDQIRTGPRGHAVVRLADQSENPIGPNGLLRVLPPEREEESWLELLKGRFFFLHRDRPGKVRVRTRTVNAAIRGTDFSVEVEEATGLTRIYVFDGEVEMANAQGELRLPSGQAGEARPGRAPGAIPMLPAVQVLQWNLYYPAVLDPDDLTWDESQEEILRESLRAYRAGDLRAALELYPAGGGEAGSATEIYRAALALGVGQVEEAESAMLSVVQSGEAAPKELALVEALGKLIDAVKYRENDRVLDTTLTTSHLAESYYRQSRAQLGPALAAAEEAVAGNALFGMAQARLAELQFAFGRRREALLSLGNALALSPRHAQAMALRGFILAAENEADAALEAFEWAIVLDGRLANAWLGRGLVRISQGETQAGLRDLQTASALEPQRALLRSYLGKALADDGQVGLGEHELELAGQLDPEDPTSWLYLALLHQRENRLNRAVRDLERSQALNDSRAVYRSRLLLDQDRAVRGANLARIYAEAGLEEVGQRAAALAIQSDYANYASHLFLANSYNQRRDPNLYDLRYETPWLSEYLVANLLAPVGVGALSQTVSQEEYSRLFERQRKLGLVSRTEYTSNGDWTQQGAQYGRWKDFSYAVEGFYRTRQGQRPNHDTEQTGYSLQLKHQLTPQDGLYVQAWYAEIEGGDLSPVYHPGNPSMINRGYRFKETQEPMLVAGYHHEWAPGSHSLLLVGRLEDRLDVGNPQQSLLTLGRTPGGQVNFVVPTMIEQDYASELEIYTMEGQHIWQSHPHTVVVGGRYQTGDLDTRNRHGQASFTGILPNFADDLQMSLDGLPVSQVSSDMERVSVYAYETWEVWPELQLVGGVSYDWLRYPQNFRYAPVQEDEDQIDQVSPKAGFIWTPWEKTVLRAGYAEGLGGVSFDRSFQLEPTQVAGFNQAWRSLIPEGVAGSSAGESFSSWGISLEQRLGRGTYLGLSGEWLQSEVDRALGVYNSLNVMMEPGSTPQSLDYEEQSLMFTAHQLLGEEWAAGATYRLSRAELRDRLKALPSAPQPPVNVSTERDVESVLHQLRLFLAFAHPSGFFAGAEAWWHAQSNFNYEPDLPGDEFWQFNVHAGYRFPGRRAEMRVGVLNLTDRDYRLSPLNLHRELPRERTYVASFAFWF